MTRITLRLLTGLVMALVLLNGARLPAQVGYPPMPLDLNAADVLFPQAPQTGSITLDRETDSVSPDVYIFLANDGDLINITMTRLSGDLVPYLALRESLDAQPFVTQPANDLAGREAQLRFTAPETAWYYLSVANDPANAEPLTGDYELLLTGTTPTIYDMLSFGALPALNSDDRVLLHDRKLPEETGRSVYIPIAASEKLDVKPPGNATLRLYDASDTLLAEGDAVSGYTSSVTQWVRVEIAALETPEVEVVNLVPLPGENDAATAEVEATLISGGLGQFVTLTPTATATATFTPTFTASPLPTATFTPTLDPDLCNGRSTAHAIGDTVVVDFNEQTSVSALRLWFDLYAERRMVVAQAYDNQTLELLAGPECFQGRWHWQAQLQSGHIGWVQESDDFGDLFLCPFSTPECRQFGQR